MARRRKPDQGDESARGTPSPGALPPPATVPGPAPPPRPSGPPLIDPDWRTLHLWDFQPVRDLMVLAGAIGLFYLGYVLRLVTVPILIAMALAYLFEPLVQAVTRRGWMTRPHTAAALIVGAILGVGVPVFMGVSFATVQALSFGQHFGARMVTLVKSTDLVDPDEAHGDGPPEEAPPAPETPPAADAPPERTPEAATAYRELPQFWRNASDKVLALRARPAFAFAYDRAREWVLNLGKAAATPVVSTVQGAVWALLGMISSVALFLTTVFLVAFFFYFFCTGYGAVLHFWENLIPERKKGRVIDLLQQMDQVIAAFVRGRLLVALILVGFYSVGYAAIGVPAALLLGPAIGLLQILPYASMIGVPVAWLLLAAEPDKSGLMGADPPWWWVLAAPALVYALGQVLDDYVLTPLIQGRQTQMDMPSIVFASLAGGLLAGVYGLLLAIPVAACLKILLREVFWPRFRDWAKGRAPDILPIESAERGQVPP